MLLSLIFTISGGALENFEARNIENPIYVYAEECPNEAVTYAKSSYLRHLSMLIADYDISINDSVSLGTPFSLLNNSDDNQLYYFPIISDNSVVATFRVFLDPVQTKETGIDTYTGAMSRFFVEELNNIAIMRSTSPENPVIFFDNNNNIMASINNSVTTISSSPTGEAPIQDINIESELKVVCISDSIDTVSKAQVTQFMQSVSPPKILALSIEEQQGDNEWCMAYAAAMIIRYCIGNDESPLAIDLMKKCYKCSFYCR